jgi:hypothetical protein
MEIFFKQHTEEFLLASAMVLVGVMAWCFIWGMIFLSENLNDIFALPGAGAPVASFNLSGAQSLNLKGLLSP